MLTSIQPMSTTGRIHVRSISGSLRVRSCASPSFRPKRLLPNGSNPLCCLPEAIIRPTKARLVLRTAAVTAINSDALSRRSPRCDFPCPGPSWPSRVTSRRRCHSSPPENGEYCGTNDVEINRPGDCSRQQNFRFCQRIAAPNPSDSKRKPRRTSPWRLGLFRR